MALLWWVVVAGSAPTRQSQDVEGIIVPELDDDKHTRIQDTIPGSVMFLGRTAV